MRKVLVFKHVAQENLGHLLPVLKREAYRIRYINFQREPEAIPTLDRYQGLIVLGGWMGVYEMDSYPHLKTECVLIEQALKKNIPILGICLGSQILAHVLGANVRKHTHRESGWCEVALTEGGKEDPLLSHFESRATIFQMHGDTFDIPKGAVHLAESNICPAQAFRYGEKAYGLQFHLEVNEVMIQRFIGEEKNRNELIQFAGAGAIENLEINTISHLPNSLKLAGKTFSEFLKLFGLPERSHLGRSSGHGKE